MSQPSTTTTTTTTTTTEPEMDCFAALALARQHLINCERLVSETLARLESATASDARKRADIRLLLRPQALQAKRGAKISLGGSTSSDNKKRATLRRHWQMATLNVLDAKHALRLVIEECDKKKP